MTEEEYRRMVKAMPQYHATASEFKRRRACEHLYFAYHHRAGVRLRGKYRPI